MKHLTKISRLPEEARSSSVEIASIIAGSITSVALGIAGMVFLTKNAGQIAEIIQNTTYRR